MSRKIKFRVWDKDLKRMRYLNTEHDFICFHSSGKGYYENMQTGPGKWFSDLMQYTGLKDKNGKEIYEGDIVTGENYPFIEDDKQNYVGIVVFYVDCASFGYNYQCVRKDKRGISNGISNEFEANEDLICENLEIIGNIYEREKENE